MKLLMMARMVDETNDVLGFIPLWIRKLAERVDKLYVFTSVFNKETPLPGNTVVYDWGGKSNRVSKYLYFSRMMLKLAVKKEVDVIFCHMSEILTFMVAPYAKLFRLPIVFWRTHGAVNRWLKFLSALSDRIVTASEEGFRIRSSKVLVTGHGIDCDRFKPMANPEEKGGRRRVLSVGRISPVKHGELVVEAMNILVNENGRKDVEFTIVGDIPLASQEEYLKGLKRMVTDLRLRDSVKFVGSVPHTQVVNYYQGCDLFVSASETGSLDKAVLEAMACEKPVLVCGKAYLRTFDDEMKQKCFFEKNNPKDLADKMKYFLDNDERELKSRLREVIVQNHNLDSLAVSLVAIFDEVRRRHENRD